jgi:hypothetical protein
MPNEQEQHRYRSDDKQGRYRLTREHNRCNEEGGVGDERQDRIGERPISLGRVFPLGSPSS